MQAQTRKHMVPQIGESLKYAKEQVPGWRLAAVGSDADSQAEPLWGNEASYT